MSFHQATLFMMTLPLLAGCLGGGPNAEPPGDPVSGPAALLAGCTGAGPGLSCDDSDRRVLEGQIDAEGGLGLYALIDRDTVLRDLTITNATAGVSLLIATDCTCTITIRNVTLQGQNTDATDTADPQSLGSGVKVWYDPHSGSPPGTSVRIDGLFVAGFDLGIFAHGLDALDVRRSQIVDTREGLNIRSVGAFSLRETTIQGVTGTALAPIDYATGLIEDSTFIGNGLGIYEESIGFEGSVAITNTTFELNGLGIAFHRRHYSITDSTFVRNGNPGLHVPHGLGRGAIVVHFMLFVEDPGVRVLTVRDSTFQDNDGMAIQDGAPAAYVDARENWWGSADGPTLAASGAAPKVFGDRIEPTVDYRPYRSAPP